MGTTRPRHLITESDEVARALDDAARRWPDEKSRARLLVRLAEEGHHVVAADLRKAVEHREATIRRTSGQLTGSYGLDYLPRLRSEWPE